MPLLLLLVVFLYLAAALWVQRTLRRHMVRGLRRTLTRCAAAGVFFSLTLVVGHGAAPVPALPMLLFCFAGVCGEMYGDYGWLTWVLLPMAVQTGLWVLCGLVFHAARSTVERLRGHE